MSDQGDADTRGAIGVLLGDLGDLISLGLRHTLATDPSLRVVGESRNRRDLRADIAQLEPHVVVVGETVVPRRSAARRLRSMPSEPGVVVLAHSPTHAYSSGLLAAGVTACMATDAPATDILAAIRCASHGGQMRVAQPSRPSSSGFPNMDELTEREWQVLELLASRESNLDIASRLHISPQTVHSHVRNIFGKLGVNSRKALAGIDLPERD